MTGLGAVFQSQLHTSYYLSTALFLFPKQLQMQQQLAAGPLHHSKECTHTHLAPVSVFRRVEQGCSVGI